MFRTDYKKLWIVLLEKCACDFNKLTWFDILILHFYMSMCDLNFQKYLGPLYSDVWPGSSYYKWCSCIKGSVDGAAEPQTASKST